MKSVATQFIELGINLSISYDDIRPIAANNPDDNKKSLQQAIMLWLEKNQSKNDSKLLIDLTTILRSQSIGQNRLANELTWPNND